MSRIAAVCWRLRRVARAQERAARLRRDNEQDEWWANAIDADRMTAEFESGTAEQQKVAADYAEWVGDLPPPLTGVDALVRDAERGHGSLLEFAAAEDRLDRDLVSLTRQFLRLRENHNREPPETEESGGADSRNSRDERNDRDGRASSSPSSRPPREKRRAAARGPVPEPKVDRRSPVEPDTCATARDDVSAADPGSCAGDGTAVANAVASGVAKAVAPAKTESPVPACNAAQAPAQNEPNDSATIAPHNSLQPSELPPARRDRDGARASLQTAGPRRDPPPGARPGEPRDGP